MFFFVSCHSIRYDVSFSNKIIYSTCVSWMKTFLFIFIIDDDIRRSNDRISEPTRRPWSDLIQYFTLSAEIKWRHCDRRSVRLFFSPHQSNANFSALMQRKTLHRTRFSICSKWADVLMTFAIDHFLVENRASVFQWCKKRWSKQIATSH